MTTPSAPTIAADVEESDDTCGDLVDKTGFGSRVLQRRSEIFPLTLSPRPDPKKGRRLSDPGRLLFNTFRAGGFGDGGDAARSKEALMSFPTGKIPDPRLEAIRSLSPTAFEAAGEEGEAAVVVYRSSRSRSINPSGGSLLPERLANKRLSLPNTSAIVLPTELGEAMGAVARADGGSGGGPLSSPPPLGSSAAAGLLIKDAYGMRRRRSISLECSRLEAILEENSHKQSRKYSLPPKSSSDPNDH